MCRFRAKAIKDTLVLRGKNAKHFIEDICIVVREDKEVIKKARTTFEKFRKIHYKCNEVATHIRMLRLR